MDGCGVAVRSRKWVGGMKRDERRGDIITKAHLCRDRTMPTMDPIKAPEQRLDARMSKVAVSIVYCPSMRVNGH